MPPDETTLALIRQLCRDGTLDNDGIDAIATDLEARGCADEAHLVRCEFIEALAPSRAQWEVDQRRARMRIVPEPDGGKGPT